MSLAPNGDLLSAQADLVESTSLTEATVSPGEATRTALRAVATQEHRRRKELAAEVLGEWVYQADLLGQERGLGPRRVWRIRVGDGGVLRQSVLVDAVSGRVLLRLPESYAALDRRVCDGGNNTLQSRTDCTTHTPVRTEASPAVELSDANLAFELTGATAGMYAELDGLDLSTLIGRRSTTLSSWVRYCVQDAGEPCPYPNAYWSNNEMYFGEGYAGADDVVAHEMTHGVIERFSNLLYLHQSGAINESIADVMGEILDHRNPGVGDSEGGWLMGEDLPGQALRDLADPTGYGQPDRMTSPLYAVDAELHDGGGVHTNSGIGNKTAFLISQGGVFNGRTVVGIDAGDPSLTKTGVLYVEVLKRLTSGADYAALGRTLSQTCAELAATGRAGFDASDCGSVSTAVAATELAKSSVVEGAAPATDVPDRCKPGDVRGTLFANEGNLSGLTRSHSTMWTTAPNASWGVPANARSGKSSIFGWNPDPTYGDPRSAYLATRDLVVPADDPTYLRFDQWRLFDWQSGATPRYPDGGEVRVQVLDDTGTRTLKTPEASAWVNGPVDEIRATGRQGFGGDSRGWTSSSLDLSAYAGQTVSIRWIVNGDSANSMLGWYLDDLEVYSCHTPVPPGAATSVGTAPLAGPRVKVTWNHPGRVGDGLVGYLITGGGHTATLGPGANTWRSPVLKTRTDHRFTIAAIGPGGIRGPSVSRWVRAARVTVSAPKVAKRGARIRFRGTALSFTSKTPARGSVPNLQWRRPGATGWSSMPSEHWYRTPDARGNYWVDVRARRTRVYRVVLPSYPGWFASYSPTVRVTVR